MPRRVQTPAITSANLTLDQMSRGIARLSKRVEELQAFDPQSVNIRDSSEVRALETAIEETLSAVFGHNTVEFQRYKGAADLDKSPYLMQSDDPSSSRIDQGREVQCHLFEGKEHAIRLLQQAIRGLREEMDAYAYSDVTSSEIAVAPDRAGRRVVWNILFLASNPTDTGRLRLDKESREIAEGLKRSNRRDQFDLIPRYAVRVGDLRRNLLEFFPKIVHFAGHGETGGIFVEDDHGQAIQVPADALADLFELCAEQIECVILNACHSAVQADAIAKHIPYVIGMNASVSDDAAVEFAVGFYDALGAGRSIDDAFKFGCNAVALRGLPEQLTPVLKRRPGGSGNGIGSLTGMQAAPTEFRRLRLLWNQLRSRPIPDFEQGKRKLLELEDMCIQSLAEVPEQESSNRKTLLQSALRLLSQAQDVIPAHGKVHLIWTMGEQSFDIVQRAFESGAPSAAARHEDHQA